MRYILSILFTIILLISVGQDDKLKRISGTVFNQESGIEIENVTVSTVDSAFQVKTSNLGDFVIKIPKKTEKLIFSHKEYFSKTYKLKRRKRTVNVGLIRIEPDSIDIPHLKNTISFLPLKLITGAFGLRIERFLKQKYSTGIYATYYFNGKQYFGSEKFTGIKISPYFRYYLKRNKSHGIYAQGTIILAYFDFSKLNYNYYNSYTESIETEFWTGGFGAAFGITDIVKNSKHFIVDINIGWQILPSNYPTEIEGKHGEDLKHNNLWWIAGGPGSLIEIKLAIGGIF